jgi:Flp pilus assembly protein TadG
VEWQGGREVAFRHPIERPILRFRKEHINDKGQVTLEFALVFTVFALFLFGVVDCGRYLVATANINTAATDIARQIEADPGYSAASAQTFLADAYPFIGSDSLVTFADMGTTTKEYQHKLYNASNDAFDSRTSSVSTEKISVKVEYTGKWVALVTWVVSTLGNGTNTFAIDGTATASIDKTMDTW